MISISNNADLIEWLDKYHYFEDECVLQIDTNPFVLTLALINGRNEAYAEEEITRIVITPVNMFSCDYRNDFASPGRSCIDDVDPIEVDGGVGIRVCGVPYFNLTAESFTIYEHEPVKSMVEPYLSRRDIFIKVPTLEIPKYDFWKQEFKKLGHDIVFRYYGGESEPIDKLPLKYDGVFFQLQERLNTHPCGIFVSCYNIYDKNLCMGFQKSDLDLDSLWTSLTVILSNIPNVIISCGNCKFTGEEWKQKSPGILQDY